MPKDKGNGKETKPSSKTKDATKIQDDGVKAKEAEAKDVPTFQPSKKEDPPCPSQDPKQVQIALDFLCDKVWVSPGNIYHVRTDVKTT